jgi:hypothetical protein
MEKFNIVFEENQSELTTGEMLNIRVLVKEKK